MVYFSFRENLSDESLYVAENFLVKYKAGSNNINLNSHSDGTVVSLNISLNDEFTGGGTWFSKQQLLIQSDVGHGLLHPGGVSHRHGAKSIFTGERYQLVSFFKGVQNG